LHRVLFASSLRWKKKRISRRLIQEELTHLIGFVNNANIELCINHCCVLNLPGRNLYQLVKNKICPDGLVTEEITGWLLSLVSFFIDFNGFFVISVVRCSGVS
jgi:hypothetical protein